jgi:P63C domain
MDETEKKLAGAVATKPSRASKGGIARAESLSPAARSDISKRAAVTRWAKKRQEFLDTIEEPTPAETEPSDKLLEAKYRGALNILGTIVPCYVLSNGQRVIGRTSTTEFLSQIPGGGGLETYLGASAFRDFINMSEFNDRVIAFNLPETERLEKNVKGLPADLIIDVFRGLVLALEASMNPSLRVKLTERQTQIAIRASMFLASVAKVGLDALIDEVTGYQYERQDDALSVKLNLYLSEELRKWEKTFPDELWQQFGRLSGWSGAAHRRPKYWGKLVNELIYQKLDKDVYAWLKENAPKPRHGLNYHQWLSEQYGLRNLVEHIYKIIGIAQTCNDISELREKVGFIYGKKPFQIRLFIDK